MFKKIKGKALTEWWPKAASVTVTITGTLLAPDGSGAATVCTATALRILGVSLKSIASTDSDFASNTKIPVEVPLDDCEFEADVTGTLTTGMIGELRGLTASGTVVDATNTNNDQVTITGFISATKCRCKINEAYQYADGA
uniref:Uncharacterized protein n=1 Tax=viral metagenome TaxID=1070528 RepID=A0A6H1ZI22_9ZZZZ